VVASGSGVARLSVPETLALVLSRLLPRCNRRMCRTTAVALNACWGKKKQTNKKQTKKKKKKRKKNKNSEPEGQFLPLSWLLNQDESIVIPAFPNSCFLSSKSCSPSSLLLALSWDVAAHKGGCAGNILPYRAHWCPSRFTLSPQG